MINVAISFTWRVEELNVLLDVLKNNFKEDITTYVFCNLAESEVSKISQHVDMALVNHFHLLSDPHCIKSNTNKQDCKRRQPLHMFIKILRHMAQVSSVPFIYTEGDVFPFNEEAYLKEFYITENDTLRIRKHNVTNPKVPHGYVSPSPMYIGAHAANILADKMMKDQKFYLRSRLSFEGMISAALKHLSSEKTIRVESFSNHFRSNHEADKNIEPVTMTSHQHNPFNARNIFESCGFIKGKWITRVLNEDSIERVWNGEKLTFDPTFKLTMM